MRKVIMCFVALLAIAAAATGPARAQQQQAVVLTTITPTSLTTYNETTPGVVNVIFDGQLEYYENDGWQALYGDGNQGSVTVTAKPGFSIDSCKFYVDQYSYTVTAAPFAVYPYCDGSMQEVYSQPNAQGIDVGYGGVKRIDVYGSALPPQPHTVRFASGNDGWTVQDVTASASATAPAILENVMAGDSLVVTAPTTLPGKVKSVKAVKWINPVTVPLTIEALTAGTIVVQSPQSGMKYTLNGGAKTAVTSGNININVVAGDKVAFYGNGTSITCYDGTTIGEGGTAEVKVYGNIMSLVDEENFATAITLTGTRNFRQLFYGNDKLKDASGLLLPATTLTERCYEQMFTYDTALTTAPALPATTLESNCYNNMFYYCTGLTTAPALPATTLADHCYSYMFANDTNLTTAPSILPATTLSQYCYQRMFHGCTRLTTAPKLPATTLANNCYNYMFYGCTSLTTAPELPATTLVPNCYAYMFQNCSNLRSVTCMATSGINSSNSTVKWLSNTAETGIFVANNAAEWPSGVNGIPEGWNRTTTISLATASDCGKIVCSAGHLHDAGSQLPEGCTIVGIMAKVNADGHGLILGNLEGRLEDAYHPIDLFYQTVNYGGTTLKRLPGYMLANLPNCATLGNIPTSNWCVASMDDYKAMFVNLGSQSAEQSYDNNVNATITAAGGIAITDGSEYQEWGFWCTSKYDDHHGWFFKKNSWSYAEWEEDNTIYSRYLLPVLAF